MPASLQEPPSEGTLSHTDEIRWYALRPSIAGLSARDRRWIALSLRGRMRSIPVRDTGVSRLERHYKKNGRAAKYALAL